jgi:ribosomal protein S18 acetylase RimI-like enzyme
MSKSALIQALETRLINAWPAFEIEVVDGWILRFAEGYSKRANSATALVPGATLDAALVDHIVGSFAARGLAPCFRLTGIEAPEAEAVLDAQGLVSFDPSLGLVAEIGDAYERDPSARIGPAAKPAWIEAAASAYGGDKADHDKLGRILRLIRQPAAFATIELDGQPAAWGLAVAERGYVGLYDLVVAPDLQGLGIGRRLVTTLLAWGRETGATRAYLQVRETNAVAAGLYASLGFTQAYRYTHRVLAQPGAALRPDTVATTAPAAISAQASASEALGSA